MDDRDGLNMTDDLTNWQKTVYDAVLWLAEELRQRDPNVALPYYVSEIVYAAEMARENEQGRAGTRLRQSAIGAPMTFRGFGAVRDPLARRHEHDHDSGHVEPAHRAGEHQKERDLRFLELIDGKFLLAPHGNLLLRHRWSNRCDLTLRLGASLGCVPAHPRRSPPIAAAMAEKVASGLTHGVPGPRR